jgi:hypothetical protein
MFIPFSSSAVHYKDFFLDPEEEEGQTEEQGTRVSAGKAKTKEAAITKDSKKKEGKEKKEKKEKTVDKEKKGLGWDRIHDDDDEEAEEEAMEFGDDDNDNELGIKKPLFSLDQGSSAVCSPFFLFSSYLVVLLHSPNSLYSLLFSIPPSLSVSLSLLTLSPPHRCLQRNQ